MDQRKGWLGSVPLWSVVLTLAAALVPSHGAGGLALTPACCQRSSNHPSGCFDTRRLKAEDHYWDELDEAESLVKVGDSGVQVLVPEPAITESSPEEPT